MAQVRPAPPLPPAESLPELLNQVWTENPEVLADEQSVAAAGYDRRGTYGAFLPTVTVSNGTGKNAASRFDASMLLFNGGGRMADIDTAKAAEVLAEETLTKTRLTLGDQLLTAYFGMVEAQDELTQWAAYQESLQQLHGTISRRAAAGVAPDVDVQTAESRILQARAGQQTAQLQLDVQQRNLLRLLNRPVARVSWPDENTLRQRMAQLQTSKVVADNHPDVRMLQAQIAQQEGVAEKARSALVPQVSVGYHKYYQGDVTDVTEGAPELVVGYTFGSGYSAYNTWQAQKTRVQTLKEQLTAQRRLVDSTRDALALQLSSTSSQYALQRQAVDSTTALVESFLRQFQAGRSSWVDVLNAQREAHEQEIDLISARKDYYLAATELALENMDWQALLTP